MLSIRSSKILTLGLLFAAGLGFAHLAAGAEVCERILSYPRVTAAYNFPKNLDVVNLRAEAAEFPVLKDKAELKRAFLAIRDTPVVKLEELQVTRRFPWPKLKPVNSGYARIPWGFSEEHCYLRAEMGAAILADAGTPLPVAISVVTDQSRLWRDLPVNEEAPQSLFPTLIPQAVLVPSDDPETLVHATPTSWSWHVSLAYVVNGELWILDPALNFEEPIKFAEWYQRLAKDVPRTQVEIGWPFALSDRFKAGKKLTLEQCFVGSHSEKLFRQDVPLNSPLSKVYGEFQTRALKAMCRGDIDKTRLEQIFALFWQVAGTLQKESGFQFDKN